MEGVPVRKNSFRRFPLPPLPKKITIGRPLSAKTYISRHSQAFRQLHGVKIAHSYFIKTASVDSSRKK